MEDEPDGWIIQHYRMGSTLTFGPWDTREEAEEWIAEHQSEGVRGVLVRCWRTVDWSR